MATRTASIGQAIKYKTEKVAKPTKPGAVTVLSPEALAEFVKARGMEVSPKAGV